MSKFQHEITQNSSVAHTFNYWYSAKSPEYFQLLYTVHCTLYVCVLYFPISFNLFEFYGMKSVDTIYIFVLQPEIHICEHHKKPYSLLLYMIINLAWILPHLSIHWIFSSIIWIRFLLFLLHSITIKKIYHEYHQHGGCTNPTTNDNKQTNKQIHTEGEREKKT